MLFIILCFIGGEIMKRLILFLVRRKLGLKKLENFKFANQKRDGIYYFGSGGLVKQTKNNVNSITFEVSGVPLNFLLSDECKIIKL